jgi:hypothetical protein
MYINDDRKTTTRRPEGGDELLQKASDRPAAIEPSTESNEQVKPTNSHVFSPKISETILLLSVEAGRDGFQCTRTPTVEFNEAENAQSIEMASTVAQFKPNELIQPISSGSYFPTLLVTIFLTLSDAESDDL